MTEMETKKNSIVTVTPVVPAEDPACTGFLDLRRG